jgi:uncharacterized protein YjbI with pentapeptide repeats
MESVMHKQMLSLVLLLIGTNAFADDVDFNQDHYNEIITKSNNVLANLRAGENVADENMVDIANAQLQAALLHFALLPHAKLTKANLQEAVLGGAILFEANLEEANLSNADLTGAYLAEANLEGANLKGTNLLYTNLGLAKNLSKAICDATTKLPEGFTCSDAGRIVHRWYTTVR